MDTMKQITQLIRKYKYVALVVLAGLALMLIPERNTPENAAPAPTSPAETSISEELELILSKIQGVGRVQVLLTEARGMQTIYVMDESVSGDSRKTSAVILSNDNRTQAGLIKQVIPPVYQGAVIVCQGGDNPSVKLSVVEAVCDATGLTADRVTVLKMK